MDRRRRVLECGVSLFERAGVWLCVLGSLLAAATMVVPVALAVAGVRGEVTVLGVNMTADLDGMTIVGTLAMALVLLALAAGLVYACTDVPLLSRSSREDEQPLEAPPPRLRWQGAGTLPEPRAAGDELMRIDGDAYTVRFTAAGELVTFGAAGMRAWDVSSGRELLHVAEATGHVALSPDGRQLAIADASSQIVLRSLGDRDGRTIVHRGSIWKRGAGGVSAIAFSPDGRRLATGSDPDTRIRDVADGSELVRMPTGPTEFYGLSIAFSSDGRYLATTVTDRVVHVWDTCDGHRVQRLDHRPHVYGRVATAVAFSPDSQRLATLCADGTAWVWDVADGRVLLHLPPQQRRPPSFAPRSLAWSPDGERLFVPGSDGTVRAWDSVNGLELLCLEHGPSGEATTSGRWSPGAVFGVDSGPASLAVSPDGSLLATAGGDGVARIWGAGR